MSALRTSVARIVNVETSTELQFVLVNLGLWEVLRIVDQNVFKVPNAQQIELVLIRNVKIPARLHVVKTQNVELLIVLQCALAIQDSVVILSLSVSLHQVRNFVNSKSFEN